MIFKTYVPPSGPEGAPILFVGESPGADEEREKLPFVGESGQILMNVLGRAGKTRDEVRLMNLSNYRPLNNKFELLIGSPELEQGKQEIIAYLFEHTPNVVCALGAQPLMFLTGKRGIHAWRGSILPCIIPGLENVKVIPTYHPAFILRTRDKYPIFDQDIQRVITDSLFKEFRYPERTYVIDPRGMEREEWTQALCNEDWLGTDIEWVKDSTHILCIGFSPRPDFAVVFANDGSSHYNECVQRILKSKAKKIFHFGTADTAVLRQNGFQTDNYAWDTMAAQHAMWSELPRSLAYLTSIYTREPYYKSSGRESIPEDTKSWGSKIEKELLYKYNGKDCCVTIEIALQQMKEMTANERRIFDFNMVQVTELVPHISDAGMLVDIERREIMRRALLTRWQKLQAVLDVLAGAAKGKSINVKSTPQMRHLLYEQLALPPRRKRAVAGKQGALTADEDAIVQSIGYCADSMSKLKTESGKQPWRAKIGILKLLLAIREVRQILSNYINVRISLDNRIRSIYKAHSVETVRWACESYIDGSGNNAQTWPRGSVEIPDELLDPNANWEDAPLFSLDEDDNDNDREEADEVEDSEYITS
jgi:uracil-DNA glycosylase family 4